MPPGHACWRSAIKLWCWVWSKIALLRPLEPQLRGRALASLAKAAPVLGITLSAFHMVKAGINGFASDTAPCRTAVPPLAAEAFPRNLTVNGPR